MASYPVEFPLDSVMSIIDIVRNSNVAENKELFAHDIWMIQGYAQKMLVGEPNTNSFATDDFDAIVELEKAAEKFQSGEVVAHSAVPWLLILKWALKILLNSL